MTAKPTPAPRPARLFFALWPDAAARERLAALASDLVAYAGGRAMPAEKIHLTLAFLGNVAPDRIAPLEGVAAGIARPPFTLRLDRTGSFRRARIGWVGAESPEPALVALQADLAAGLRAAGFALEERPFAPHVTLARAIERALPQAAVPAIEWRVASFSLVESVAGGNRYATRQSWALAGGR